MSIFNDFFHVKQSPILSMLGFGGGGTGTALGGSGEPFTASGGNIANGIEPGNGYKYHTFGASGALVVTGSNTIEVLVVAGGGGGQTQGLIANGGGGGGGVVHAVNYAVTTGSVDVSVGDGGTTGDGSNIGTNGGDSYFGAAPKRLTAKGGGCSGVWPGTGGNPGGSGAGGMGTTGSYPHPAAVQAGKTGTQPAQTHPGAPGTITNYGHDGGSGGGAGGASLAGGSGGGAGGGGDDGGGSSSTPSGGPGQPFTQFAYPLCFPAPYLPAFATPGNPVTGYTPSPNASHYGGGGGGGKHIAGGASQQAGRGVGGAGGGGHGGNGRAYAPPSYAFPGIDYLGGGAGDQAGYDPGDDGGKGVVIVRYAG